MPSSVASAVARISADDSRLQRTLGRAQRSLDRFSRGGSAGFDLVARSGLNLAGSLTRVGTAAGIATTAIAALTLREAAQEIGDFGAAISKVEALTGLAESSEALSALREQARNLGSETQFSATQAAEGMAFLAQAGFDANDILASTGNFLNLATVGGLDLAEAMDIASNVMSGFGLPASESARIADVLASASASANTNVAQLGEAFKAAGPVAKLLGIEIEDAAAAIGVLGNVGIQGSDAGTALRNVMLRLASGGSEVEKGLASMNLTLRDVSPSANSVSDVFQKLIDSTRKAGLTADETASAFSKVFGVRATAAGASLAGLNVDIKELAASLRGATGEAKRMAGVLLNNLTGDILIFQSALDELFLTAGDAGFESSMRDATKAATEFLRALGDNQGLQDFVSTITGEFDGALKSISATLDGTDFDAAFESLTDTFRDLQGAASTVSDFLADIRDRVEFDGALNETINSVQRLVEAFGGFAGESFSVSEAIRGTTDVLVPLVEVAAPIAKFMAENAVEILSVAAAFKTLSIASSVAAGLQSVVAAANASSIAVSGLKSALSGISVKNLDGGVLVRTAGGIGDAAGASAGSRFASALALAGPAIGAAIVGWQIGRRIDEEWEVSRGAEDYWAKLMGLAAEGADEYAHVAAGIAAARQDEVESAKTLYSLRTSELQIAGEIRFLQEQIAKTKGDEAAALVLEARLLIALQKNMNGYKEAIEDAARESETLGENLRRVTEEAKDIDITVEVDATTDPAKAMIEELQGGTVQLTAELDTSAAEAKIAALKAQQSQLKEGEIFDLYGEYNENTIQGVQGKLNDVRNDRDRAEFGSVEFQELTEEAAELSEKLKEMSGHVSNVNDAAGKTTVAAEAEKQGGIAKGEVALKNRFDRQSAADLGTTTFEQFKSEKEDPLSYLRERGEEITDIKQSDLLVKNLDKLKQAQDKEADAFGGAAKEAAQAIEKGGESAAQKLQDAKPEENRQDFLEREIDKYKDQQGLINKDRRLAREEEEVNAVAEGKKAAKEIKKAENPNEQRGPMTQITRLVRQIDEKAGDIKKSTADTLLILKERLPTAAI